MQGREIAHVSKQALRNDLDQHTGGCIMCVDELSAMDEPPTETSPLHTAEEDLPVQSAKCFLSGKWLEATGELLSGPHNVM